MSPSKEIDSNNIHSDLLPAPGELDVVRRFLNTERRDDATGQKGDMLPEVALDESLWSELFENVQHIPEGELATLKELRADLRALVGEQRGDAARLNRWIEHLNIGVETVESNGELQTRYSSSGAGAGADLTLIVLGAIQDGSWSRLKACPDCGWVFYDRTRSKTKVWCRMNSGSDGRGCGSIAKTRRYRQKRKHGKDSQAPDA